MNELRAVEPDYNELLKLAHRRWINERTPAAAEAFDRALLAAIKAGRDRKCRDGQSDNSK